MPTPAANEASFCSVAPKASAGTSGRSDSRTSSQKRSLCAPNRITAREDCELNEDGLQRMASLIRASISPGDWLRFLPRLYWLRRLRRDWMTGLFMGLSGVQKRTGPMILTASMQQISTQVTDCSIQVTIAAMHSRIRLPGRPQHDRDWQPSGPSSTPGSKMRAQTIGNWLRMPAQSSDSCLGATPRHCAPPSRSATTKLKL